MRIAWAAWCVAWTVVWCSLAANAAPHRACTMPMLIIIDGNTCAQWGSSGSWPAVLILSLLALASLAAAGARRPG